MKKIKGIIALALVFALVCATAVFAADSVELIDTSAASLDNPITYTFEDGSTIVVFDPSIKIMSRSATAPISVAGTETLDKGSIFIPWASTTEGSDAKSGTFTVYPDDDIYVRVSPSDNEFTANTYNVALINAENDSPLALRQSVSFNSSVYLTTVSKKMKCYCRFSSYDGQGNASYAITALY